MSLRCPIRMAEDDTGPVRRSACRVLRGTRWARGVSRSAFLLALLCTVTNAAPSREADFVERVHADTRWLTSYRTRQVGTAEHDRFQNDLLDKLRAIPGVKVWTHEFPVLVPVTTEAVLEVSDGAWAGRHPIRPLWPDGARLNTTSAAGIRGRLVYVGDAAFERLPAHGIQGQIAVMDMSAYVDYRRVFDYGAAAVILVESPTAGRSVATEQSLYKPRYYVESGPLADALRANAIGEARILCTGSWQQVTARNIYVGVAPAARAGVEPYAVVAAYDSMSRVMGLAPGADMALDCAAVLNILRDEAASPTRPLLFGFLDAYHVNQLGMRYMAALLTVTPDGRTRRAYADIERDTYTAYQEAADELAQFDSAVAGIANLHDRTVCKHIRRMFKDAVGPEVLSLKEMQGDMRLASLRSEAENTAKVRAVIMHSIETAANALKRDYGAEISAADQKVLEETRRLVEQDEREVAAKSETAALDRFDEGRRLAADLLRICTPLLRVRNRILAAAASAKQSVDQADLPIAQELWARMANRVNDQLAEQARRVAFFDPMDELRREIADSFSLSGKDGDVAACSFVVGIDLSDCGVLVGPGEYCAYNRSPPDAARRDFDKALKRAVKGGGIWPADAPYRRVLAVNAMAGREVTDQNSEGRALITSAAQSFQLPGVTWATVDAPRWRVDTPLDRFDRLDWSRIAPQLPATRQFLQWVFTTSEFTVKPRRVGDTAAKWRHGMGRIVDVSAGETVPRVPRAGFLTTLIGYAPDVDGIRRCEFTWTGADGSFRIPLLCADVHSFLTNFNVAAFKLDDAGRITEALSTTESLVTARLATSFSTRQAPGAQLPRAVTFECAELNGPSFLDARFLEPLTQGVLLDTVRGGAPKQAYFRIDHTGQMWGLVEPGIRWQLILRAGAGRTRLALLNAVSDGREKGLELRDVFQRGYAVDEPLPSIPTHAAARDISLLDDWRLADFQAAGIRSEKISRMREDTREALRHVDAALAHDDGAGLQRWSDRALANEIRAYQAIRDTGQDVARGAIFLMLMLVPFCVAMERLLFACTRIGRQIMASVLIFALMTALLWSFHPAFRISAQPLVIVMAFTILAMSVTVINMLLRRFKGAVQEFQSTMAEGSGAKMGRGGLLGSAIFLGIANMRKRKVRTLLTGSTIVLVTFALLCFSSTSSYVDKKDFRLEEAKARHPSILVRRASFGPLSWAAAPVFENLLGDEDVALGMRSWLVGGLGATGWRLYLTNPGTGARAAVRGVLGLPAIEDELTGANRVLSEWATFAAEGGCYISEETAAQMKIGPGDTLVLRGRDLIVRGVFNSLQLEDEVLLLDGQRLAPYDYTKQEQDWINRDTQDAIEQETGSAAAMQPDAGDHERYVPASDLIVVPTELARELGGDLRSFGIACSSLEQAAAVAHRLMETIVYPVYYANRDGGVNVVVATPLVAAPPKNLAIPLVIAALIIFTTMLNSVSERKNEIYVYTSLGLAPSHVGALFVAEALTYGLMGAVFGYVAGQGTAAMLTGLGWMPGVTLNYSGTAVIKTMLLVQGVVVLSAIVPAFLAGRVASPSSETDWKVPQPVDGVIRDVLPFTVHPLAAPGLIAFVYEYLEAHRDGVLGKFDVDTVRLLPGDAGRTVGLETRVWLEPFDMGVRQTVCMQVDLPEDDACWVSVEIRHEAGAPKTWWRLNKPFFSDVRRQLLGWRKLGPERLLKYVESAAAQGPRTELRGAPAQAD